MARCEDFPCCGHTDGEGCPDTSDDRFYPYPCVECGGRIRRGDAAPGHESFHQSCLDRMSDDDDDRAMDFDGDEDCDEPAGADDDQDWYPYPEDCDMGTYEE